MNPERFRLAVRLLMKTDLHISGQGRTLPLVDKSVEVDESRIPFIPASSFRGRVRAHLERLLKANHFPVCSPPRPDNMCPHNEEVFSELQSKGVDEPFCIACRIFGSAWRDAAVAFSNLKVGREQHSNLPETFPTRTGVSINRRLGTSEAEQLFMMETVPHHNEEGCLRFEGTIEGALSKSELGWLIASIRSLQHIGANKARGLGRVQVEATDLKVGNFVKGELSFSDGCWKDFLKEAMGNDAT
jgi:CRISPR/Cas system CSM-associated protein Csm3 (group 7 of RAMP superfamily)